jgi:hypothetical protein
MMNGKVLEVDSRGLFKSVVLSLARETKKTQRNLRIADNLAHIRIGCPPNASQNVLGSSPY